MSPVYFSNASVQNHKYDFKYIIRLIFMTDDVQGPKSHL